MTMTIPFTLPGWLPIWVPTLCLLPLLLWLLAFLCLPFNVFGTRGRLDAIETRLDEIEREIRALVLRLGEPVRLSPDDEIYGPQYSDLRHRSPPLAPDLVGKPAMDFHAENWSETPGRGGSARLPTLVRSNPKAKWPET